MKAFIPYIILGAIGLVGAVAGTRHVANRNGDPAPDLLPSLLSDDVVKVTANLQGTHLSGNGGDVFARIALEGVDKPNANKSRVPVSLTIVIDRSGSMAGSKMEDAKRAAREAIASLSDGDRVCVISFDNGADDHGCDARDAQLAAIDGLFARGGTDMIAGIDVGGRAASRIFDASRVNRILLLSDGRPNSESGLREQVSALAKRGITTTTLGLGADYNEDLMSALADAGLGRYYFIDKPEQLAQIFLTELSSLATIVARGAVIELVPANGTTIVDVIGFAHERSANHVIISAGDIYAGRTTDILVRLRTIAMTSSGNDKLDVVKASVSYTDAGENKRVDRAHTLAAVFTLDQQQIDGNQIANVVVKAEKWRAAQAYVDANDAYNRNDFAAGDKILAQAQTRLEAQAAAQQDGDLAKELAAEKAEMGTYQLQNAEGGFGARASMNKKAKARAWSMNKGSAY